MKRIGRVVPGEGVALHDGPAFSSYPSYLFEKEDRTIIYLYPGNEQVNLFTSVSSGDRYLSTDV